MKIIRNIANRIKRKEYIPLPSEGNFDYNGDWESDENEKYKIIHSAVGLRDCLPFKPTTDEVIYIENEYDEQANNCIKENIDFIRECFAKRGFIFVYLPLVAEEIKDNDDYWHYRCPFADTVDIRDIPPISSNFLLYFLMCPEKRQEIRPCFARYNYGDIYIHSMGYKTPTVKDRLIFDTFELNFDGVEDLHDYFEYLSEKMSGKLRWWSGVCCFGKKTYEDADDAFDDETRKLLKEVRFKIEQLRRQGVSDVILEGLVKEKPRLSKLVITKDYRIILPDYKNMEINMEPLVKSVFLLFLKHPEGIIFKSLPDYRKELSDIYDNVKGTRTPRNFWGAREYSKNIIALTDPLNNSINEKCTRIKEAFLLKFHESLAEYYYITGQRGMPKKICLPEKFIVWE